ncbi:TPA: hypothetical protein NIG49_001118 [Pseudomonas aeruginosa]|nr:hypothetical protein [Pseudomonas aeruginosa]HCF7347515.1 hypothetical protein [Pseudomonas aeruginosa]
MRLDGALARTGTRCKSTGKGGHRTWLSCFTRLGNSQGSKLKSISYKIRLSQARAPNRGARLCHTVQKL